METNRIYEYKEKIVKEVNEIGFSFDELVLLIELFRIDVNTTFIEKKICRKKEEKKMSENECTGTIRYDVLELSGERLISLLSTLIKSKKDSVQLQIIKENDIYHA